MKGLRDKEDMTADIASDGAVTVENHYVGRLKGFRFWPDTQSDATGVHGKAARGAAAHVLAKELAMRARRVAAAKTDAFKLARNARILWRDEEIARLEPGDDPLKPTVVVIADDHLTGPDKEKVQQRLDQWIGEIVGERLKPLVELKNAEDVTGLARGIAFRLTESLGIVKRDSIADEMRQLDQPSRAQLRKYGVRFGAFNIFLPPLLKPAPAELTLALWCLNKGTAAGLSLDQLPDPPRAGLTSTAIDPKVPEDFYRSAGYHVCGPRAIRVDMLERLADSIRPLLAWRASEAGQTPPRGSSGDGGFMVTPEMMSILGCSSTELAAVLETLGFRSEKRPMPKPRPATPSPVEVAAAAPEAAVTESAAGSDAAATAPEPEAAGDVPQAAETDEATADAAAASGPVSTELSPPEAVATAEPAEQPASETTPAEATPAIVDTVAETVQEAVAIAVAEPVPSPGAEPTAAEAATTVESPAPDNKAEADVPMIDVWRPRRRHREDRRPQQHREGRRHGGLGGRPGAQSGAPAEAQGDRPGGERGQGQRHGDRRNRDRHRDRGPAAPGVAGAAGEEKREGEARRDDRPAHSNDRPPRRDDRDRRDARPDRGDRGGGDRRPQGDRRDDQRRRDDRFDRSRPRVSSASPQRKGGPDPDSPFAALSALKQQLEKSSKTPSS